jgi:hypothetical protein
MTQKGYDQKKLAAQLDKMGRNAKKKLILENIRGANENQKFWMDELQKLLDEEAEEIKRTDTTKGNPR